MDKHMLVLSKRDMKITSTLIGCSLLVMAGCATHDPYARYTETYQLQPATTMPPAGVAMIPDAEPPDAVGGVGIEQQRAIETPEAVTGAGVGIEAQPADPGTVVERELTPPTTQNEFEPTRVEITEVRRALNEEPSLAPLVSQIHITAINGTITLNGTVESDEQRKQVEEIVRQSAGVQTVENQLEISLEPTSDRTDTQVYTDAPDQEQTSPGQPGAQIPQGQFPSQQQPGAGVSAQQQQQQPGVGVGIYGQTAQQQPGVAQPGETGQIQPRVGTSAQQQQQAGVEEEIDQTQQQQQLQADAQIQPGVGIAGQQQQQQQPGVAQPELSPTSDRPGTRVYEQQGVTPAQPGAMRLNIQGASAADQTLVQQMNQQLRTDPTISALAPHIQINVMNGRVILQGAVRTEQEKSAVETAVQRVSGVAQVENHLRVGFGQQPAQPAQPAQPQPGQIR
jgi:osmotically-inducible protein OsmY